MEMFHSDHFELLGVSGKYDSTEGFHFEDHGKEEKRNCLITNDDESEASKGIASFCTGALGLNQVHGNTAEKEVIFSKLHQEQQLKELTGFACFNDPYFGMETPPFQSREEEITKLADDVAFANSELNDAKKERPYAGSLQILNNYRRRFRKLNVEKMDLPSYQGFTLITGHKLSTDAILKLAAQNFIQSSSKGTTESFVLSHPYASSFGGLCVEDTKDVKLVQYLLASAELVAKKQFECAGKLLLRCDKLSSDQGNTIERLVYYFSGALHERIDRETGTVTPEGLGKMQSLDILDMMSGLTSAKIAMQKSVPFGQVSQFAGTQGVLDHVADATKIHIVDLEIRTGMHYTILMQALATRSQNPIEYLKVTAIGTKSKAKIEETGRQLASFAQALKLKFSINIIMVADIMDLNENLFEINADEAVAVWVEYYFMFMIRRQVMLESLMNVVKAINPLVMIVTEVEGNHNSPVFVTRFTEALFFYGAFFDSLEDCLKHDPKNRMLVESVYLSQAIRNIVATEGEERTIRQVAVNVWKAFFARFGMVQVELSMSSMYQANLVLKNFECGSSCTLNKDGKGLIIGWKGTPIHSLSAWKFGCDSKNEDLDFDLLNLSSSS
ncbi:DELLA protein RGL2-like [Coffea eugenioides]|uniref:DELLA protein RGL2-like n=1 Tax=Coffea eugenioides TaxID=49369 RepID=UPI000F611F81|nr:DELLA protein RGL2-like [Coffea eugenioides]